MQLAAKLQALRDEYMRFSVEKCASVLREYRPAVENITGWFDLHSSHYYNHQKTREKATE